MRVKKRLRHWALRNGSRGKRVALLDQIGAAADRGLGRKQHEPPGGELQRRELAGLVDENTILAAGLDPKARPETLSAGDFAKL